MELKDKLINIIKTAVSGLGENKPTATDYKTKDGKILSISEDGKSATIDGQPANGTIMLEDGTTYLCENGVVTSVQAPSQAQAPTAPPAGPAAPIVPPAAPAVNPDHARIAALQAELDQIKAEKQTADLAKAKAEKEASEALKAKENAVVALGKVKTEVEALSKETIGSEEPPSKGMKPFIEPVAIGKKTEPQALSLMASRTFIADTMPWLERFYKGGKYTDGTDFSSYRSGGPNAVSILETNLNYTWNGILTTDLFFKPALGVPALADFFTVDLGASHKKVYNLVTPISKVLQPYTGCGGTPAGNRELITNTTIQLKPFQMYESWCKDDFTGQLSGSYNLLAQEWLKTGNSSSDPAGTPINNVIMDALKYALQKDVYRRVFFAAGNSSDTDYNQIDGFWDRNIDSSGAANYCVYRDGTSLGTGTLAADAAKTRFESIYANSNLLLKEVGIDANKVTFWVTRSVWENYYTSLVGLGAVTEQAYSDYKSGAKTIEFRGIPVKPINMWDSLLAESDNPLYATTRHLIALTMKENHILGVENNADLEKIETWFEMKDQKRYYRSNMTFGYQYLHCDLTTISY